MTAKMKNPAEKRYDLNFRNRFSWQKVAVVVTATKKRKSNKENKSETNGSGEPRERKKPGPKPKKPQVRPRHTVSDNRMSLQRRNLPKTKPKQFLNTERRRS
jgi:hypothetical protein